MNKKAVTILIICISAAVIITIIALVSCSHRNAEPAVTSEEGSVEETTSETSTEESSSETSKTTSATTTTTTEGTTTSELAAEETTDSTTSGTTTGTTTSNDPVTPTTVATTTTEATTTTTTEATTEATTVETTVETTPTTTAAYRTGVDVEIHIEYITDWESGASEHRWYTVHNVDPNVNWSASDTKAEDALVAEYGLDRDAISDIHEKTVVATYWSDGSTT